MKRIHTLYISLLIIFSFFIIITNSPSSTNEENDMPVTNLTNNKFAYLTFDDGPSENTYKILDILDIYEVQATFFVVGPSYKLKNDLLKEIINRGHNLAIHSYNHEYSRIYENEDAYIKDFYECYNWIKNVTGKTPNIYRFPGGSSTTITNKNMIQSIIQKLHDNGFIHTDWNVDSFDSHYNSDTSAIINSTLNCIKINEANKVYNQIILMHDNTKKVATVEALPIIIEKLLAKQYQFKVLDDKQPLIQHIKRPV